MEIRAFPGDAVCLATGGCGIVFGRSTNSVINTGTAASARSTSRAPATRTASSSRSTRPPSPAPTSSASSPRARAARAAASGCRRTRRSSARRARRAGEGPRLLPRGEVPRLRQPRAARHREPRAVPEVLPRGARASTTRETGKNENEVYLDLTHMPEGHAPRRSSPASSRSTRSSSARTRTRTRCGSSPPCTTRWAASGSTSSAPRTARSMMGSPRNHATNIPGLYAAGEVDYQYHGANRLGANSLLSCIYAGMVDGPGDGDLPRRTSPGARGTCQVGIFEKAEQRERENATRRILEDAGRRARTPTSSTRSSATRCSST